MPNKRAKNKVYLGGYLDRRLHARVVRAAANVGMQDNVFGYVALLLDVSIPPAMKPRSQTEWPSTPPPEERAG